MMQMLRKAAVYVMFAFLIIAFSLWGVGDYVQRQTKKPLAQVGSIEISQDRYAKAYERAVRNLSTRARRRITPEEAQAFGLPLGVMQSLIQEAALDGEANALGLGLSSAGLENAVTSNKFFQDEAGKFNKDRLQAFLDQVNLSEAAFLQEIRSDLIRRQLRGVFDKSAVTPKALLDAYNSYANEQRELTYFTLGTEAAGEIPAPAPDVLQKYYTDRKAQFMTPELRKVQVVAVTPDAVRSAIALSDAELKAAYDARPDAYAAPEKRKVELIPFQTKRAAEEAATALAAGKEFLDVAKEAGFKQPEIDLGLLSKKEFANKSGLASAQVDAVFAVEKGKVTAPLEGPLSTSVGRVLEVIPAVQKTLEEVKDQLRADVIKARTTQELGRLTKAFEDDRQLGTPLSDAAQKLTLPVLSVTLDATGKAPDGKPATTVGLPGVTLADAAFKSDVGVENQALRIGGGSYAWFDVTEVVKPRQKPLEEVASDVEALWRREQVREKLGAKARALSARLEKGEKIADVAKAENVEMKVSKPVKRNGSEPGVPPSAVSQAFNLSEGSAASAIGSDGVSRTVFQITKILPPELLSDEATTALRQQVATGIADDNLTQFVADVKSRLGTKVDTKAVAAFRGIVPTSEGSDE